MAEAHMDLVLEHLHAIRNQIDDVKHMFDKADRCLTRIEITVADIQRIRSEKAKTTQRIAMKMDSISQGLNDIELRLGAVD